MTKSFITSGTGPPSNAALLADTIASLHSLVEGLPGAIAEAVAEVIKAGGEPASQAVPSRPAFGNKAHASGGRFIPPPGDD